MRSFLRSWRGAALLACAAWACLAAGAWAAKGKLTFNVFDKDTGSPVACRMHLKNAKGKPVKVPDVPYWHDHFVFDGQITLELPKGRYTFEIERGPEYREWTGHFDLMNDADDSQDVELERIVDMAGEGWWSGDLHIHRPPKDIELLMRAEDLHFGPVITWWNKTNLVGQPGFPAVKRHSFDENRFVDLLAGEDERQGGALLFFRLDKPLEISKAEREFPSPMQFLLEAKRQPHAWVDVEKPFWWDVPAWVASGKVDSIGLANNHLCRDSMYDNEAWGKPRDKKRFASPLGNGRWSQHIYFQLLNCGLRLPPSAGSASGVLPNPVGYNRAYVYLGEEAFSPDAWWEGLRNGRVLVTNGPLLRVKANDEPPGHVFAAEEGDEVEIELVGGMDWRDRIEYVEVVRNGEVAASLRIADWVENEGKFPPLKFTESGWFLVRAVTENPQTYRFASTGPWYVEFKNEPRRISQESSAFFADWVAERMRQIDLPDPTQKQAVLEYHEQALEFWHDLQKQANAP